ncbi:MAG: transposase [Tepidisphaeraceae bacterium]
MAEPVRKRLRRRDVAGTARYLTFSCYRRLPLFSNDAIKARFVADFTAAADRFGVRVLAWVVMPEHVHLIVVPDGDEPLTPFLTASKRPIAVEAVRRWRSLGAPVLFRVTDPQGRPRFWQPGGGYDRNVVDAELIEKIRYTHANPVRRRLAATPVGWPWSSARRFAGDPTAIGPPIAFDLVPVHAAEVI